MRSSHLGLSRRFVQAATPLLFVLALVIPVHAQSGDGVIGGLVTDTLGGRSDSFGRINQAYNRQQAELAVRVIW